YVPASGVRPAMHGDRVLVRVERFQRRGRTEGRVVRVLERGTRRVIGVLRRGRTSAVVVPQEQRITVPIVVARGADGGAADGDMGRDFDDAVLVEPLGTGFRLTVAVADVAHYVPAGSSLDLEARARGTSVYFPDRVLPMLPEELSNGICSLKPDEDRLVKAVRMELHARGQQTAVSFHDAVMRSAARPTYPQVRQALRARDPAVRAALA